MNLNTEFPYAKLPRIHGELEVGDIVMVGFHVHSYLRVDLMKEIDCVGNDLQWLTLLSRGGRDAWASVTTNAAIV